MLCETSHTKTQAKVAAAQPPRLNLRAWGPLWDDAAGCHGPLPPATTKMSSKPAKALSVAVAPAITETAPAVAVVGNGDTSGEQDGVLVDAAAAAQGPDRPIRDGVAG